MERPAWAPRGIDITVPSVSRIHDYYLGGSHNFEADREAARRAMRFLPGLPKILRADRAFTRRAVRWAVGQGVTQFLDIGSGIPAFGNVHESARAADPGARVVLVDHDPVAVAHSRTVLEGDERAGAFAADLRRPRDILEHPVTAEVLDLTRPVAVLFVGVLHFVADADDPYAAVAELTDGLAPGSLLILTHAALDAVPAGEDGVRGAVEVYRSVRTPLVTRSREGIARFLDRTELVEPGLVPLPRWRPDGPPEDEDPYAFSGFGAVGRAA
ncbi:SAM-dependent methyltransferase [Streptomyces sp. NPDC058374]|uniref:SAM-dependent methyltransferase n=1 Tax=unclassified Streptomyces TaxID=2593676 RepID=UPI00366163E4